jgi:hypothetical protein
MFSYPDNPPTMSPQMFRTLLLVIIYLATSMLACAQNRPTRPITIVTSTELFSRAGARSRQNQTPDQDGVASITYAQLFREGDAQFTNVDADTMQRLPQLPTGYRSFKNLGFKLQSKAVASGSNIVVFNVPSAAIEDEFNGLRILHIERDELSPSGMSWVDRTILRGRWREEVYPLISEENFNKLIPDFSARKVSAVTDDFGIFVIASVNTAESSPPPLPFTEIAVAAQASPEKIRAGSEVSYTFTILNKGPRQADYVGLIFNLDMDMDLHSATSSQGSCRESSESTGKVLCFLKPLLPGESSVVEIKAKLRYNKLWSRGRESVDTATVVVKEHAADLLSTFVQTKVKTIILPEN